MKESKIDKDRIAELTELLSEASRRLREDQTQYDSKLENLNSQLTHYQKAIETQRKEHEKLVSNAFKAREEAIHRTKELAATLEEKELVIQHFSQGEAERKRELVLENQRLREELVRSSGHFVRVMEKIQQESRDITGDVMNQRNRLQLLSTQQTKLRNILNQLMGRRAAGEGSSSSEEVRCLWMAVGIETDEGRA